MRGFAFLETALDRQFVYPSSIPLDTDILGTNKNAMVGLGFLAQDILGTGTAVSGLPCTQTSVASLAVLVGAGRIYSMQSIDGAAYGSLAADTTHQILKQGILLNPVTLATPAPLTAGQSINYLVEAAYQDSDINPVTLQYYNASNPAIPLSGPGNTGAAQPTVRSGVLAVQVKTGAEATTGSQVTPAPDAGFVGLYVVTVANGQSTITSADIAVANGAPFLGVTLPQAITETSGNAVYVTQASAAATYLTSATAAATYLTESSAAETYLTSATAAATYLTEFSASETYLTQAAAAATYLTQASLSGTFLTQADAAATYAPLTSFANALGSNGYQKVSGGLIFQWGQVSAESGQSPVDIDLTFPVTFPTVCFGVWPVGHRSVASSGEANLASNFSANTSTSGATVTIDNSTGNPSPYSGSWFAIGY